MALAGPLVGCRSIKDLGTLMPMINVRSGAGGAGTGRAAWSAKRRATPSVPATPAMTAMIERMVNCSELARGAAVRSAEYNSTPSSLSYKRTHKLSSSYRIKPAAFSGVIAVRSCTCLPHAVQ